MNWIRNKQQWRDYLLITLGTAVMAVATSSIYDPAGLVTGGFSGLAIVIKQLSQMLFGKGVPLWVTNLVLNIPLFLFGIRLQLRILADPLRFGLRRTDGHLGLFFSVSDPRLESDQPGDYAADDQPRHAQQDRDNQLYLHTEFMHLLRFLISIL